jgi:N6-adenosine-specific RNA methylase IME4
MATPEQIAQAIEKFRAENPIQKEPQKEVGLVPFPNKKYDVIVVDPPWPIKKITTKQRPNQTKMDYPLMTIEEIKNLPIATLGKDTSYCFLWTTQKHLFKSKQILEGYGYNHLLTMGWTKEYGKSSGMALYGFRWNLEFILVGIRGTISLLPKQKLVLSGFSAVNIGHSIKPDIFYTNIEHLGQDRIDIFARRTREGWDVWGNEV